MTGYLEVVIGPMFAGKSTYLIGAASKLTKQGAKVLILSHKKDTRSSSNLLKRVVTHSGLTFNSTPIEKFTDVDCEKYDFIGIDESHMFDGLVDFTKDQIKQGIHLSILPLSLYC